MELCVAATYVLASLRENQQLSVVPGVGTQGNHQKVGEECQGQPGGHKEPPEPPNKMGFSENNR